MKQELDYFLIENAYGGSQDWFRDPMMHLGGCGAATACDTCIYLAIHHGLSWLYPYDQNALSKRDYIKFSKIMKPYLSPRMNGIDRLDIYTDGFISYLNDLYGGDDTGDTHGRRMPLIFEEIPGETDYVDAVQAVQGQIDSGMPAAFLLLKHQDPDLKDYVWHWFLLTGYEAFEDTFLVKAVTYGGYQWLDFSNLWDTGFEQKGGMVMARLKSDAATV